ncbi:hypothetical protein GSI_06639 [Ganoderma sinense ZZ0214-1]|uniref:Rad21/Rec8-like protein N-terminal domain-containing protein n=1 Tax=Ganoderma sinense ZZ0214-1 TaxID=1077348 RepID=A0A2G8SDU1_9APHY|nr:hypothetical protein GSI_06639 [Ganoderma sinense ZZ0214-1]
MFFSQDLLERRDSGYGLLWGQRSQPALWRLAATLGAKSSFKKLPKRSVLTADISQLCGLIAEPPEPLALRLSSNLMIGVARVYKVKQEIFLADVTTCFNSLKKAVQDVSTLSAAATDLQMGQPSLRPETLTLVADPEAAFGLAFDSVYVAWDERIQEDEESDRGFDDDEFDPKSKKPKSKGKQKQNDPPLSVIPEQARALHTLEEDHKYLLAAAFEGSLSGSGRGDAGFEASSSVADGGFAFDDDVFALPGEAGIADIGDELARELGEGWGGSIDQNEREQRNRLASDATAFGPDPYQGQVDDFRFDDQRQDHSTRPPHDQDSASRAGSLIVDMTPFSPRGSDVHSNYASNILGEGEQMEKSPVQRKAKRVRLLLDSRIELTDEELKRARANYVQQQEALKREVAHKKLDKENSRRIEEMIYGAPRGVEAPVLVDFWLENFRLHVGAHSGQLHVEVEGEPPRKRRKVQDPSAEPCFVDLGGDGATSRIGDFGVDLDWTSGIEDLNYRGEGTNLDSRLRSSEEPGEARHASRPPSALGSHLDFDFGPTQDVISGSQRSSFFPWDHAGPSSSAGGGPFSAYGSDGFSGLRPGSKRGSSVGSLRDSLLLPPGGSTILHSPIDLGLRSSQTGGEDFQFNVGEEETQEESQQSNVLALEKNSFNFLERVVTSSTRYAKMQLRAFPSATSELSFDDVVPKATSTRRVAAAAFYHCLVLSTKDLVSVSQVEPYTALRIRVK